MDECRARRVLMGCLLLLSLFLSFGCGSEIGRSRSGDLLETYLRVVREGDQTALERLFDQGTLPEDEFDRNLLHRLELYRELQGARLRVVFAQGPVHIICSARVLLVEPGGTRERVIEDVQLTKTDPPHGGNWALLSGEYTYLGPRSDFYPPGRACD